MEMDVHRSVESNQAGRVWVVHLLLEIHAGICLKDKVVDNLHHQVSLVNLARSIQVIVLVIQVLSIQFKALLNLVLSLQVRSQAR